MQRSRELLAMARIASYQTKNANHAWCKGCKDTELHKSDWIIKVKTGNLEHEIGVCDEYIKKNNIKTRNNINIRPVIERR